MLQGWFAPNLTDDPRAGLGRGAPTTSFNTSGLAAIPTAARPARWPRSSPISTSKLDPDALRAIATYLKDLPGHPQDASPLQASPVTTAGRAIYRVRPWPAISPTERAYRGFSRRWPAAPCCSRVIPRNGVQLVLEGARHGALTDARPTTSEMPAYGWKLSDAEVAAVLTYAGNDWGNASLEVTARREIGA